MTGKDRTSEADVVREVIRQLYASEPFRASHFNEGTWTYSRHASWQAAYAACRQDEQAVVFAPIYSHPFDGLRIMRTFGDVR